MKAKIFSVACIAAILFACQTLQGQIKFGFKAGVNMETQSELGQLWDNDDISVGLLVGSTFEYSLTKSLSLQTELNFQQKGEKFDDEIVGESCNIQKKYNYLNVPLIFKVDFGDKMNLGDNWNIYAYAGPYYGYLISGSYVVKAGGNKSDTDITNSSIKDDWGAVFGGGVSHTLNNGGALFSELRYDMGLYSIDNDNSDLRNKTISLCFGYKF